MVTKSREQGSCRNPWSALQPTNAETPVSNLVTALDPKYDNFFAGFPETQFNECILYQDEENEAPFYPRGAEND
ncbi:hypothetical protein GQ53DRAFT_745081 [Thozetella sp. PMI_491]|nr:hypothetical protein GQ53DRAFT_745081 [Thozetella sp. PMI_491]